MECLKRFYITCITLTLFLFNTWWSFTKIHSSTLLVNCCPVYVHTLGFVCKVRHIKYGCYYCCSLITLNVAFCCCYSEKNNAPLPQLFRYLAQLDMCIGPPRHWVWPHQLQSAAQRVFCLFSSSTLTKDAIKCWRFWAWLAPTAISCSVHTYSFHHTYATGVQLSSMLHWRQCLKGMTWSVEGSEHGLCPLQSIAQRIHSLVSTTPALGESS